MDNLSPRLRLFLLVAPLVIGFDQFTKALASMAFSRGIELGGAAALVHAVNDQALQGALGAGWAMRIVAAAAALALVFAYLRVNLRGGEVLALGVVAAAACANGFDFAADGAVVDFLALRFGTVTVIANAADLFLLGGLLVGTGLVLEDMALARRSRVSAGAAKGSRVPVKARWGHSHPTRS